MQQLKHLGLVLAVALLAPLAVAQDSGITGIMTVNPGILTEGSHATIEVSDPTKAGQVITITIWNGDLPEFGPQFQYVQIELDANGDGKGTWPVPSDPWEWWTATFMTPGSRDLTRVIQPAPQPPTP